MEMRRFELLTPYMRRKKATRPRSAIYIKFESEITGQMESTHGTGNAAAGTCYYKLEIPNLKWPDAGLISTEVGSFQWGVSRPVVVKPDKSVSLNFSRIALKYP